MNFIILSLFLSSFSWSLTTYDPYDSIPDHAPLSSQHDHVIENFLDKSFKTDGEYDYQKVEDFLQRLRREKQQLFKEMAEAIKLEKIELNFEEYSDAMKEYNKAINEDSNDYAQAYSDYLEPVLEKAKLRIAAGAPSSEIDSLIDSFMTIYYGFFRPGIKRNFFIKDMNPFFNFKEMLRGFSFSKFEPETTIEANNLEVGTKFKKVIEDCLQRPLAARTLLTQNQIEALKACQFDISQLDPGKSTYWTANQVDYYDRTEGLFPVDSDRLFFTDIRYSGGGSLKLGVKVDRIVNGKKTKIKFKMKLGIEVPQELISSSLSHKVGMHQDIMKYYPKVKLYLPKGMNYLSLQRLIRRKYNGNGRTLDTFVESRSEEDEEEQWVVIRNVMFEVNHPDKINLDSYEIWGGDLPNRREFRGALAFFSWINLQDIRPDNVRFALAKRKDGTYAPEYSIQDAGQSLGLGLSTEANFTTFATFMNYLRYQDLGGIVVNSFMNSHMKWNDEYATFNWFENNNTSKRFDTTTYSDVKWMARKIAKMSFDELSAIVRNAAIHPDEQTLYILKLANRRNEMVKAFDLTEDYPLFDIPDLSTYSPNSNIQNGKIAVASLPGMSKFQRPKGTLWPLILQGVAGVMSLANLESTLKTQIKDTTISPYIGGVSDLGAGLVLDRGMKEVSDKFSVSQVIPGVKLYLNREVGLKNNFLSRNDGSSSRFYVRDSLKVEITVGSKALYLLTQDLPLNLSAKVKAWGREFTHTQTASSVSEAYKSPVKIFHVIKNIQDYAASHLEAEEIVSVADSYGFQADADVDLAPAPFLKVGGAIAFQWQHSKPIHFYRDTMGQLHTYLSTAKHASFGVGLDFLNINYYLAEYPVMGMEWSKSKAKSTSDLYTFLLPKLDMNESGSVLTAQRRKYELAALRDLMHGHTESPQIKIRRDASLELSESETSRRLHLFGIFHKTGTTNYSQTRINYLKEEEKLFHRYFYSSEDVLGIDSASIPFFGAFARMAGTIKSEGFTVDVQMEEDKPLDGVVYLNVFSFRPRLDRKELKEFINEQSRLYAESDSKLFYRDMELPSADEVNDYRKLYAHHRIYIKAAGIIDHLSKLSNKEIKEALKTYYRPTEGDDHFRFGLSKKIIQLKVLKKKVAKNLDDHHDLVRHVAKVVKTLRPDRTGIQLMRRLFGMNNIYVMGDIVGVNSSINHMESHNLNHDRRFAGTSWGVFPGHPPIRKFLMDKEVAPLDYLVNISIKTTEIYGRDPEMDHNRF